MAMPFSVFDLLSGQTSFVGRISWPEPNLSRNACFHVLLAHPTWNGPRLGTVISSLLEAVEKLITTPIMEDLSPIVVF